MDNHEFPDGLRVPPHSLQAEESVLGGLMLHNNSFDRICDVVDASDFYLAANQQVYAMIAKLISNNRPADAITVGEELEKAGELESAGGLGRLVEITQNVAGSSNIESYAGIVRNKAVLRGIITIGSEMVSDAFGTGEPLSKLENAQAALGRIADRTGEEYCGDPIGAEMLDWVNHLDERFNSERDLAGISTGFDRMDWQTNGLGGGDLFILAARPSMGKTALSLNLAANVAEHGGKVLYFSLEMPRHQLIDRLGSWKSKVPMQRIKNPKKFHQSDWGSVTAAVQEMKELPIYVDDRGGLHINQIKAAARRHHRKSPLSLIVIDYLQLIRGDRKNGDSKAAEVGSISRACKELAKELDIPVIVLSQLNRGVESRTDKRPMMSDLRESGEIEQDADIICMIYRDDYYFDESPDIGLAEIIISKNRNGETGKFPLEFRGETQTFLTTSRDILAKPPSNNAPKKGPY